MASEYYYGVHVKQANIIFVAEKVAYNIDYYMKAVANR